MVVNKDDYKNDFNAVDKHAAVLAVAVTIK